MGKRLKILALSFLFPNKNQPFHGVFVLNRLKTLSKYVDIKVINPIPWSPLHPFLAQYKSSNDIPSHEVIGGLDVYHPRFFSVPRYFKSREAGSYLRAIEPIIDEIRKEFDFDIIDMHWTFPDLPAGLAMAEKYQKKTMVTLRGMEAFHLQDSDDRKLLVAQALTKVDAIVALSNELRDYGDVLSGDSEKSTVICNGVDTDAFYWIDREEARAKLGLPTGVDQKIILGVGSLIHRKGFDLVIDVLPELVARFHGLRYYVIGSEGPEGDYRAELKAKVKSKGLEGVVIFHGAVANDDLVSWYNSCDVFCLSSRGEGSPNVLSEALSCGAPAVSTAVGSAPEIMAMANYTDFVLPGIVDSDSLRILLDRALCLDADRSQDAAAYRKYDWDWCAKSVIPVYQQLMAPEASLDKV